MGDNSYTYGQKNVKVDLNNLSDLVILPFNDDKPQDQESIELSIMDEEIENQYQMELLGEKINEIYKTPEKDEICKSNMIYGKSKTKNEKQLFPRKK